MRSVQTQFELTNKSAAIARNRDDKTCRAINVVHTEKNYEGPRCAQWGANC